MKRRNARLHLRSFAYKCLFSADIINQISLFFFQENLLETLFKKKGETVITYTPMFWEGGGFVSSWMAHPASSDYLTVGWALSRSDAHTRCPGMRTSPYSIS
jgi:hypothetical protein